MFVFVVCRCLYCVLFGSVFSPWSKLNDQGTAGLVISSIFIRGFRFGYLCLTRSDMDNRICVLAKGNPTPFWAPETSRIALARSGQRRQGICIKRESSI